MVEIHSIEDLRGWLRRQPRDVSVAIAARAALRVAPLVGYAGNSLSDYEAEIVLALFRATATAVVSVTATTDAADELRIAAEAASTIASVAASDVGAAGASSYIAHAAAATADAAAAARAATAADGAGYAAFAADAAAAAAADTARAAATATYYDAAFVETSSGDLSDVVRALLIQPLWFVDLPDWATASWSALASSLRMRGDDWETWIAWYEARLKGALLNVDFEVERALISNETWKRGPAAANQRIKEIAEKHVGRPPPQPDFFISYNQHDLDFARWLVEAVLEKRGYRCVVQYRDMPAGGNFVLAMQKALEESARVIALVSEYYLASEFCRAEWTVPFAADPTGDRGRLVPLKVRPCERKALLCPRNIPSLVGLDAKAAERAVLEAIGHPDLEPLGPAEWPGEASAAQLELRDDVEERTPQAEAIEVAPETGDVDAQPPEQEPDEPGPLDNESRLSSVREAVEDAVGEVEQEFGQTNWYGSLRRSVEKLGRQVERETLKIDRLDDSLGEMMFVIAEGQRMDEIPEHVRLSAIVRDLTHTRADLRAIYPKLVERAAGIALARIRNLSTDEEEAVVRALMAVETIVTERMKAELDEIAEQPDPADLPPDPDARLPDGEAKQRLYKLGGYFVRLHRIAHTEPDQLKALFDEGVDAARKIEEYRRAAETLDEVWKILRRWLAEWFY